MIAVADVPLPVPGLRTLRSTATPLSVSAGARPSARAQPRVLVIDDEEAICELLSLYLAQKDLQVATVQRAGEARIIIELVQFDLVVLDWKLDGVEGLDLLHLCKVLHPDIPVIIYTGADLSEGSLGNGLAHEADAVIRKMGPLAALCTAVFKLLDQRQAGQRNAA